MFAHLENPHFIMLIKKYIHHFRVNLSKKDQTPVSGLLALFIAMVFWLKLNFSTLLNVWTTGTFSDTDDAMQSVEMRDWVAGQAWFDMTQFRMDPPDGVLMHWSRLYDAMLAGAFELFHLGLASVPAERAMRIAVPGLLYALLISWMIRLANRFIGRESAIFAALFCSLSVAMADFSAGAISHHAIQVVLLMTMIGLTLESITSTTVLSAVGVGCVAALSEEISLETLPFIGVTIIVFSGLLVVKGSVFAGKLIAFAVSFALASVLLLCATLAPGQYSTLTYDAFSLAHVGAACIGGLGLVSLAARGAKLRTVRARLIALALCGGCSLLVILWIFPDFLRDPLFKLDPLVRQNWLNGVAEGQPLVRLILQEPTTYIPMAISIVGAMGALFWAALRERGENQLVWVSLLAFGVMGVLGTLWEIRVAPLATPVFILGAVWLLLASIRWVHTRNGRWVKLVPFLLILPFLNMFWSSLVPEGSKKPDDIPGDNDTCFAASAYQGFKALPKGLILSPIDHGPHFLAFTDHSVVSGPYHRDNRGLSLLILTWASPSEQAEAFVRASGATYLAYCPPAHEFNNYVRVKSSFAAELYAGHIPQWLTEVPVKDTPFKVFSVK